MDCIMAKSYINDIQKGFVAIFHHKSVDPVLIFIEAPESNDVWVRKGLQNSGLILEPFPKLGQGVSPVYLLDSPG